MAIVASRLKPPRNTIDSFDPFNTFHLTEFLLMAVVSNTYVCRESGTAFALERCDVRINCEAVMWKISTHGFTLEEVLIMTAMNLLASADMAAKREKRAPQE